MNYRIQNTCSFNWFYSTP